MLTWRSCVVLTRRYPCRNDQNKLSCVIDSNG